MTTAVEQCTAGIDCFVRWRADAMGHIDAAIVADQSFALPRIVKAWMLLAGRDANYSTEVSLLLAESEHCLESSPARERTFWLALKDAHAGRGVEAATVLEGWLDQSPTDLLAHQLIQNELFWMGRVHWMHDVTERAAPAWGESTEGYGPFLSLRAFANEEAGCLEQAERFGRMATEIDPADIWGAHAVAHVLDMQGEVHAGVEWLESLSSNWEHANQLRHHLWWHVCLFLLETGQHERILDLLGTEIRNPDSPLVKASPAAAIDIQNYSSLLLRLELYGVDVDKQWTTLAELCAGRVHNHGNAFANVHDMMVLTATGQFCQAEQLLDSMRNCYHAKTGSVALSYNAAGIPACEAILAHRQKNFKQVLHLLGSARHELSLMGASHVQRDIFYHLLVHAASREGRGDLRAVFLRDVERMGFYRVPERLAYRGE